MPYLGNEPGAITDAFTQTFTGNGSTTNFTLSQASTTDAVFVRISGVMQRNGTDFTVSGTTLAFTTAPPDLANNIVVQFFTLGSVQEIAADAVTVDKLNLISTASVPSLEAKGDGSSQDGYIQLNCSQNSHGIKLKAPPHSASQSYTLTYPSAIVDGGFMKTDSSGNLSFAAVGGAMTLIDTEAPSAGASAITLTGIDDTYASYFFKGDDLFGSATESIPYLRLGDSSGVDSGASDYAWSCEDEGIKATAANTGQTAPTFNRDNADAQIEMCGDSLEVGEQTGEGCHFIGYLHGARASKSYPILHGLLSFNNHSTTLPTQVRFNGSRLTNLTTTSITFLFNTGTIQGGRFSLFGIKNA